MQELDKRIGMLRIMLADVEGKRVQLADMEKQYHAQLSRIVEFVVYREGDVGNALSLMSEVQLKQRSYRNVQAPGHDSHPKRTSNWKRWSSQSAWRRHGRSLQS